ncbi:MAG: endonuclease, partial [Leptotrichia sp.]
MKKKIIKGLIFIIIILGLFCCSKKKNTDLDLGSGINRSENTVLIASFNALRLGEKQKDYLAFAKILANFDLIGIEEVMNEKGVKKVKA